MYLSLVKRTGFIVPSYFLSIICQLTELIHYVNLHILSKQPKSIQGNQFAKFIWVEGTFWALLCP